MRGRPREAVVTEEDVREALLRPPEYRDEDESGFAGDPLLFRTWALGPAIVRGDGTNTEQVDEGADLYFFLRDLVELRSDWQGIRVERHHGWVDHITYRVLDDEGKPTRLFRVIRAWREDRAG